MKKILSLIFAIIFISFPNATSAQAPGLLNLGGQSVISIPCPCSIPTVVPGAFELICNNAAGGVPTPFFVGTPPVTDVNMAGLTNPATFLIPTVSYVGKYNPVPIQCGIFNAAGVCIPNPITPPAFWVSTVGNSGLPQGVPASCAAIASAAASGGASAGLAAAGAAGLVNVTTETGDPITMENGAQTASLESLYAAQGLTSTPSFEDSIRNPIGAGSTFDTNTGDSQVNTTDLFNPQTQDFETGTINNQTAQNTTPAHATVYQNFNIGQQDGVSGVSGVSDWQNFLVSQNSGPAARNLASALTRTSPGYYGSITQAAEQEYFNNYQSTPTNNTNIFGANQALTVDTSGVSGRQYAEQLAGSPLLYIDSPHTEEVRALQNFLNANGADLIVDGDFGNNTARALGQYQRDNNLSLTGSFDSATRRHVTSDFRNSITVPIPNTDNYQPLYARVTAFHDGDPNSRRGINSTGSGLRFGSQTTVGSAAVDPEVIPYGSKIIISTPEGLRYFIADDTGGDVKTRKAAKDQALKLGLGTDSPEYNAYVIDVFSENKVEIADHYENVIVVPYEGPSFRYELSNSEKQEFYNMENFTQLYANN